MKRRQVERANPRREYGGPKLDQAERFKDLERENERLKKAVSELTPGL